VSKASICSLINMLYFNRHVIVPKCVIVISCVSNRCWMPWASLWRLMGRQIEEGGGNMSCE